MSSPSDFDFDLDSILAEFSDTSAAGSSTPEAAPESVPPAAPASVPSAAAQPHPARRHSAVKTPAVEEPTVLAPPAKRKKPSRPAKVEEEKAPRAEKAPAGPRRPSRLIPVLFALLSVLSLCWLCLHVRPDEGSGAVAGREDLPARLDLYANNAVSAALGDTAALPKLYAIAENATAAPKPDPTRYGSTTDTAQVEQVIALAAELLDGQSLAWDPNAQFMPGSEFKYYLDDSLFVLCWKEIIDGKCCSCAEVKMADGSQIRRKLAGDSYGSSVQLYATQMARDANAVVAINGDFYAFRNLGVTVYQRQLYRCNLNSVDSCFFTAGGDMLFAYAGQLKSEAETKQFIQDNNVLFSLAFGPVLVDGGELKEVNPSYPIGEVDHYYSRSSIGQLDTLHYLLMTVNYEGDYQHTCTIAQSGEYMFRKGCQKAYALDGGQTSIIVFRGDAYNRVDWDNERSMSDILYFASAVHREEVTP
ncbi:MAG: phosphodiester glycosidase family protein [Oscillospiraceae bacterium]|nr:phosphodiester glycosidase family protein [Oscillospiraceae bacterium]